MRRRPLEYARRDTGSRTRPLDLSPVFPDDDDGNHTYVVRYRPGSHTLISKDVNGKPLKAVLEVRGRRLLSQDPTLEDPAGTGRLDHDPERLAAARRPARDRSHPG